MPFPNKSLPKAVKDEARDFASKMMKASTLWLDNNVPPGHKGRDVDAVMQAWYFTNYYSEEGHHKHLARFAKLGISYLMRGWDVGPYCLRFRDVQDIKNGFENAVEEWNEDAKDEGISPEIYYDPSDVKWARKWLGGSPFSFWLLGCVIEEVAQRWVKDHALDLAETHDSRIPYYCDANAGIRDAINKACVEFFRVFKNT